LCCSSILPITPAIMTIAAVPLHCLEPANASSAACLPLMSRGIQHIHCRWGWPGLVPYPVTAPEIVD
jgi:hypothetical protein